MNIILFGPPGAGKGTQSNNISKKFNLHKVSTGDLLREESKKNTALGNNIRSVINEGKFVSDKIINDLIITILSNKELYSRLIFDGYPRNLNQAKDLDLLITKYDQKIACVLSLNVDKETVLKRILGRQTCGKCGLIFNFYYNKSTNNNHECGEKFLSTRSDDNKKTLLERFKTYEDKTLPILEYYKKRKILKEINGVGEIDAIFYEIHGILASLET